MRQLMCGLLTAILVLAARDGRAQPSFNNLRGNPTPGPTYSQTVRQRAALPQYGCWYGLNPKCDAPVQNCCGPVCFQPYWVPPVFVQSFSFSVFNPVPFAPPPLPEPVVHEPLGARLQAALRQPAANAPAPIKPPPAPKPQDELDQKAEMQRLLRKGNDAFGQGDYKQALGLYQQAIAAAPLEPTAYFHLAQAHVALGKLSEAGVAIERGMRLHANWPLAPFQPRALYRDLAGDYQRHLGMLADEVGKNLNDESLLFLLGYQLWFDGKRDEAVTLFQRAGALAHDTTLIDRFLRAARPQAAAE
jgi:tetratricopeptide (TPR) repeat protein